MYEQTTTNQRPSEMGVAVLHCKVLETTERQSGFTLIELIMVIVLVGGLAVFAAPRVFNSADFNARGFHDQTLAYLRYAQKTAVAQRRTVCVVFTGSSVTLTMAASTGTTNCTAATATALPGPGGETPATLSARSGIAYSATPTSFNFDGLGQPITSAGAAQATQTFQVATAAKTITVETITGYVHE